MLSLYPLVGAMLLSQGANLGCTTFFAEAEQRGILTEEVSNDYKPLWTQLHLFSNDGWTSSDITYLPAKQRLPGVLEGATFAVRFTEPPRLPLMMRVYADDVLRWQRTIDVPFWPLALHPKGKAVGKDAPGVATYISRADDKKPVSVPRDLRIELTDARNRSVGTEHVILPGNVPSAELVAAFATLDKVVREQKCTPPPPPIN